MSRISHLILSILAVVSVAAGADECAGKFSELSRISGLSSVRTLFGEGERIGLVNETQGSYVVIESRDDLLWISFYTSGLFDLYGIKDEGPLIFCSTASGLRMSGLKRNNAFMVVEGRLIIDDGGRRKTFAIGAVPELLRKLHHLNERAIASEL